MRVTVAAHARAALRRPHGADAHARAGCGGCAAARDDQGHRGRPPILPNPLLASPRLPRRRRRNARSPPSLEPPPRLASLPAAVASRGRPPPPFARFSLRVHPVVRSIGPQFCSSALLPSLARDDESPRRRAEIASSLVEHTCSNSTPPPSVRPLARALPPPPSSSNVLGSRSSRRRGCATATRSRRCPLTAGYS